MIFSERSFDELPLEPQGICHAPLFRNARLHVYPGSRRLSKSQSPILDDWTFPTLRIMGSQKPTLWGSKQTLRKRESNRSEGPMRFLGHVEKIVDLMNHFCFGRIIGPSISEGFESVFFARVEPSKWRQFFGRVRMLIGLVKYGGVCWWPLDFQVPPFWKKPKPKRP